MFDRSSLLFGMLPEPQVSLLITSPFFSPPAPVYTEGSPFLPAEQGGEASGSKANLSTMKLAATVPAGSEERTALLSGFPVGGLTAWLPLAAMMFAQSRAPPAGLSTIFPST